MSQKDSQKKELTPDEQMELLKLLDRIENMFDKISFEFNVIDNNTRRVLKKNQIKNILENIHNI